MLFGRGTQARDCMRTWNEMGICGSSVIYSTPSSSSPSGLGLLSVGPRSQTDTQARPGALCQQSRLTRSLAGQMGPKQPLLEKHGYGAPSQGKHTVPRMSA